MGIEDDMVEEDDWVDVVHDAGQSLEPYWKVPVACIRQDLFETWDRLDPDDVDGLLEHSDACCFCVDTGIDGVERDDSLHFR